MKLAAFLLLRPPEPPSLAAASIVGSPVTYSLFSEATGTPQVKRALVRFEYEKTESNELDVVIGEHITVTKTTDSVWWEGIDPTGARGLFPKAYVEMLGGKGSAGNTNDAFSREVQPPRPLPKTFAKHAVVSSDLNHSLYSGDFTGLLDLTEGAYVTVIKMVDQEWWFGGNSEGEYGLFPSRCVELETDQNEDSEVSAENPSAHAKAEIQAAITQPEDQLYATENEKASETQPESAKPSIDGATFDVSEPISPLSSTTSPKIEYAIQTDDIGLGSHGGQDNLGFQSPILQVKVDEWFATAKGSMLEVLQSPVNDPQYLDPQLPLR